jgi:hypothetical protein
MRREPVIQRIKPDETGRVLDRRRIRRFYLLLLPVLLPLFVGAAGVVVLEVVDDPEGSVIGFSLFALGVGLLVAYCVYESFLVAHYPARCYLRWLRERIDRRPDAVVKSDDADAFFVQIIPRENWTMMMGENAADMGLLRVDPKQRELRYEGDVERWTIPAEAIRSFRLRSFTPPGSLPFMNAYTVVVLIVELDDREIWETPLAAQPIHFELWTPGKRRRSAELLEDVIGHLVDPEGWPAVKSERLWPLRPPPRFAA